MERLEILVVDDKKEDFKILEREIKSIYQEDSNIYHVTDEKGIDEILTETPTINVIFMDLMLKESDKLPNVSGLTAIEYILKTYVTIPIVIITGYFKDTIQNSLRQMALDDQRRIIMILDKMNYTDEDLFIAIEQCIKWKEQYENKLIEQQEIDELVIQYEKDIEKFQEELENKINELGKTNLHPAKDKNVYREYLLVEKIIQAIDPTIKLTKEAKFDLINISRSDSKYINSFVRIINNKSLIKKTDNRPIASVPGLWEHKSGFYRLYYKKKDSFISIENIAHKNKQEKIINSFK